MLSSCCPSISRSDRDYKQATRIKIGVLWRAAGFLAFGASALYSYGLLLCMKWPSTFAIHVVGAKVLQHCTELAMIDMRFQPFLSCWCVWCRLMDSADDVQGLGKGVKRRIKKHNSSKAIAIQADSQLPVTCLQVMHVLLPVAMCCLPGLW